MDSLSKNKIKWVNSLRLKKNRIQEQHFVVEGEKIVSELLHDFNELVELIITTDEQLYPTELTFFIDEKEMKRISEMKTPSKVIAVVKFPRVNANNDGLILAVDGVQDPGNMGTIIRTADWFGVRKIICSKETVDVYSPKVVQASMGSIFRTEIIYADLVTELKKFNLPIYGALLDGSDLYKSQLEKNAILVVGNEGNGISPGVQEIIDHSILIPKIGEAESLNVAIATGILLAEFNR